MQTLLAHKRVSITLHYSHLRLNFQPAKEEKLKTRCLKCRVKRHLISTSTHERGSQAESNLEQRFLRSRENGWEQNLPKAPNFIQKF